jgi:hypothetical protein
MPEQDVTVRTGLPGRDSQDRTARTGLPGQDCQGKVARIELPGQDCTDLPHHTQEPNFLPAERLWALEPDFQYSAAKEEKALGAFAFSALFFLPLKSSFFTSRSRARKQDKARAQLLDQRAARKQS